MALGNSSADLTIAGTISALGTGAMPANVQVSGTGVVVLGLRTGISNWEAQLSALPAGMTLNFAGSWDNGVTYHAISGTQLGGSGIMVSSTTIANNNAGTGENNSQVWIGMAAGLTHLAIWCGAYLSGSVSVVLVGSTAVRHVVLNNGLPPSTNKIGIVTTDQTAHGTSDLVAADITKVGGVALVLESGALPAHIDNFPATQPVSAASLPLPTGAATSAKQPALGVAGTPSADVTSIQGVAGGTAVPISAAALPLPAGAAVESGGHLASMDAKMTALIGGGMPVDVVNFPATQPVSETDGSNVTLGAKADAAVTNPASSSSVVSALKGILTAANSIVTAITGTLTTKPPHIELAGLSSTSSATPLVASQDCLGYKHISISLFGTWTGTVTFQQCNDNTNWGNLPLILVNSIGTSAPVNSSTAVGQWTGPISCRYVRFIVTFGSGTIQGVVEIDVTAPPVQTLMALAAQSGNWTHITALKKDINSAFNGVNTIASRDISIGSVTTNNSKSGVGKIYAISATNGNASIRWFQLFNALSATGTPIYSWPIPISNGGVLEKGEPFFGTDGIQFATGLSWGVSTSATSYVAATAADHNVSVHYI